MAGTLFTFRTFSDVPHWSEQVRIEGEPYVLRFEWNGREGYWYVALMDAQESAELRGAQKVIPFTDAAPGLDEITVDLRLQAIRRLSLFPGYFPGLLYAYSVNPLRKTIADLDDVAIDYLDEAALADLVAEAEAQAA